MKKLALGMAAALLIGTCFEVNATPKKVIITRHGNKVIGSWSPCMSLQGIERAQAMVPYFSNTPIYQDPPISHVFASYVAEPKPQYRPKQTCQPFADYINVPLNTDFKPTEHKKTANEILKNPKYDGDTVLLCWEHHNIPDLVAAFGPKKPEKWPEEVFDQVYVITYDDEGNSDIELVLQKLIFGDRANFDDKPADLKEIPMPCPKGIADPVNE